MLFKFFKWLAKRNIEGIVKSQCGLYEATKLYSPNLEEADICRSLFKRRFKRMLLSSTRKENQRISRVIKEDRYPKNIFELCLSIAEVEFGPQTMEQYFHIHDIILNKLQNLGYQIAPSDFKEK